MSKKVKLSNGWEIKKLGDLNFDISDGNYSHLYPTKKEFVSSGIPFLRANNISKNTVSDKDMRFISKEKHKILKKGQLKKGDLLFTNRGVIGQVGVIPDKYIGANINAQIVRINSGNLFTNKYLMYVFTRQDIKNQIKKLETGSTLKQLPIKKLCMIEIPIPSLQKQKQIAKTLDKAQELISLRKESISKLDELAKSLFIDMFGDPFKNTNNYILKTIKKIGKVQTGNTPPRKEADNYGDFIEWIKSDNILKDKFYLNNSKEYLSEKGLPKGRLAVKGSLLFTCIAGSMKSIGNVGIVNRDVTFNQQINAITPYEDNTYYLYFLFKMLKKYFEENSTKSMKIMINKSTFESLEFPIAPLDLQKNFAKKIEKIEEQKTLYEKELEKLQYNFDALLAKSFNV